MSSRLEVDAGQAKSNVQLKAYYKYAACTRGFTVAWIILTLCFMIINIIVFIEPEWIGDTPSSRSGPSPPGSPGVGYVGLYQLCEFVSFGHKRICDGAFQDFSTILTDAFRASTFFIGVSCLLIFLCVLFFLLFLCVYEVYVYIICGVLQVISTVFMFLGCVIFPHGWDHMYVRRICGDDVWRYKIGQCEMRWAYILAIIGIFDIMIIAIMAFVLACYHRGRWRNVDQAKQKPKGEEVDGYVMEVTPASDPGATGRLQYRAAPSVSGYATSQPGGYIDNDGVRRRNGSSALPPPASSAAGYGSRSAVGGVRGGNGTQDPSRTRNSQMYPGYNQGRRGSF